MLLECVLLVTSGKQGVENEKAEPRGIDLDVYRHPATQWEAYLIGGTVFGMGWAIIGTCPGPLFITVGAGYWPILVAILGALLGTLMYGVLKSKLPH